MLNPSSEISGWQVDIPFTIISFTVKSDAIFVLQLRSMILLWLHFYVAGHAKGDHKIFASLQGSVVHLPGILKKTILRDSVHALVC